MGIPFQDHRFTNEPIQLSHSKKSVMQACGRAFRYKYVDRLGTRLTSANLGYGAAIHQGTSLTLTAQSLSGQLSDPTPAFNVAWDEFITTNAVGYSSNWDADELRKTAEVVLAKFREDWAARGWEPVFDIDGVPVIEREFKVQLPGNVIYTAIIDALVRTRDGLILVLDFKTPLNVSKPEFYEISDQLLGYQIVCDAHATQLGITKVDGSVFYELTKVRVPKDKKSRGEGPKIHVTDIVPRRSDTDVNDWILETQFVAQDIRNKRFQRRTMDSYNSPCTLCDWTNTCRGIPDPNIYVRNKSTSSRLPAVIDDTQSSPF